MRHMSKRGVRIPRFDAEASVADVTRGLGNAVCRPYAAGHSSPLSPVRSATFRSPRGPTQR